MAIEARTFRTVLGHFATGVTVVTTRNDTALYGFTANAFTSVSLEPPLILIAIGRNNTTLGAIEASGIFCVNIMGADQRDLVRCFATNGPEKYEQFCSAAHHAEATGAPVLDGALAWLDCRVHSTFPGGDHLLLLGEVQALGAAEQDTSPLLFYRGTYHSL